MASNRIIPPNVCGKIQGTLKIKVDEVYWSHKLHDQVLVHFKWWGSTESFTFFPEDITRKDALDADAPAKKEDDDANCLQFDVCTSLALLETYLTNSAVLVFNVVSASDDSPLGEVRISAMKFILTQRPFSSYFPIVNDEGLHLGDLHVCFHLTMNKDAVKSKKRVKLKSDPKIRGDDSADEWARVAARGLELRQAMVESVVDSGGQRSATGDVAASEAKLVDYLMGKELSKPEEDLAIKTLRCISPAESLVEVATCAVSSHFVPKTEARVVKSDANWIRQVPKTRDRRKVQSRVRVLGEDSCNAECFVGGHQNEPIRALDSECDPPIPAHVSKTDTIAKSKNSVFSSISSYRLTVKTMRFSADGLKKINYHPTIRPQDHKIRTANPPGVLFSVEIVIPFLPKGKSRCMKPVEVTSRNFTGEDVIFDGAIIQKTLRGAENPWKKVSSAIGGCQIKALWRHLNQRIPSLLGVGTLPDDIQSEDFEKAFVVQVCSQNGLPVAKIEAKVELGIANCFGNELLGGARKATAIGPTIEKPSEHENSTEPGVIPIEFTEELVPGLEPVPEETKLGPSEGLEPPTETVLKEVASLDNKLLHAIDSLQEKLKKKEEIAEKTHEGKIDPKEKSSTKEEKNTCRGATCCCCCKCCHGNKHLGEQLSSARAASTQVPSSSSSSRGQTEKSHRRHRRKHRRPSSDSEGDETMPRDFRGRRPEFNRRNYEMKTKEKDLYDRNPYGTNNGLVDVDDKRTQVSSSFRAVRRLPVPSSYRGSLEPSPPAATIQGSTVHRYKIDVYSCDAQVFYKAGVLEFYLSYRFPVVNPIYETVEISQTPTTIELSGEPMFQSHILKLNRNLSDSLRSLSERGIIFEIWARSFMYDKRNFLLGQAELPIERLLDWETAYDYSEKRRVTGNFYPPDKHFVNLRMRSVPGDFPPGVDGDMISQLGLEVEYEKVGGIKYSARDMYKEEKALGEYPEKNLTHESRFGKADVNLNLKLRSSRDGCTWGVRSANSVEYSASGRRDPSHWRRTDDTPCQESEWGDRELQEKQPFPEADVDSPLSFTPYQGVPSFIERDLSPRRERDFPAGTQFVDFTLETNVTTPVNSVAKRRSPGEVREDFPSDDIIARETLHYVPELDNSLDIGSDSKATQTSQELAMASRTSVPVELFSARVEVEMALNLSPVLNQQGSASLLKPTTHVEFQAWLKSEEIILSTPSVKEEYNPEYNCAWNVHLPVHYLYKDDSEMEFRLVYENDPSTVLKAYVDLTTLSAGLSSVNGWYSLGSNGHKSAGQIKVSVTPVDDIRKYKEIWINEYRRKSSENKQYCSSSKCDAAQKMKLNDSQRTESLRHKIQELEVLTQKMKDKMANIQSWNKSPPDQLMQRVEEFSRRLDEEDGPLNVSEESIVELPLNEENINERRHHRLRSIPPQIISSSSSDDQDGSFHVFNFESRTPMPSDQASNEMPSLPLSPRRLSLESNSESLPARSLNQCLSELGSLPKDSLDAASAAIERIISDLKKQKIDK